MPQTSSVSLMVEVSGVSWLKGCCSVRDCVICMLRTECQAPRALLGVVGDHAVKLERCLFGPGEKRAETPADILRAFILGVQREPG